MLSLNKTLSLCAGLLIAAGLMMSTPATMADELSAPETLIKSVSGEVLNIVAKNKDEIKGAQRHKILKQVTDKIEPYFNFMHMTKLAMGRNWKTATPTQQKALTDEFRSTLLRTYSKALSEYENQTITLLPQRTPITDAETKVRTEIRKAGAKPIALDYYLEKIGNDWKVFDIEVEGVSLITNYRSTFATEINNGGIDGLIKSLQEKNSKGQDLSPVNTSK